MRMIGDGLSKRGRSGTVDDIRQRNGEKREVVGNSGLDDALKRIDPLWALDVKPTLVFDFARNEYGVYDGEDIVKGQFIDHATVSRNSVAAYTDATGRLRTAGVDEPRFTYDPETGERRGLLIEEQRTNQILQSENFTSGNWIYGPAVSVNADVVASPRGDLTADEITLSGSSGHNISQGFSQVDGQDYTLSVWAKNLSGFNSTFQLAYYNSSVAVSSTSVVLTDEWKRFDFTFTAQAGVSSPQIRLLGFGSGVDGNQVSIWGAQLEAGSFESSYIKTEGTQVTRAADDYSRTLGAEFNENEFTIFAELEINGSDNTDNTIFALNNTTQNEQVDLRYVSATTNAFIFRLRVGGANVISELGGTKTGGYEKVAISIKDGELVYALNGVVQTKTGAVMPSGISVLDIGQRTGSSSVDRMRVKSLYLRPRALSAEELQTLTAPKA